MFEKYTVRSCAHLAIFCSRVTKPSRLAFLRMTRLEPLDRRRCGKFEFSVTVFTTIPKTTGIQFRGRKSFQRECDLGYAIAYYASTRWATTPLQYFTQCSNLVFYFTSTAGNCGGMILRSSNLASR